jgi:hypothetical protein
MAAPPPGSRARERHRRMRSEIRRLEMLDLFMIGIGVASFAILILYTAACERM